MGIDTDKIKKLREKAKLTQAEAAKAASLAGAHKWNEIEKGHRENITLKTLERIARALGVSARDLLKP